jgi:hypothetical protein
MAIKITKKDKESTSAFLYRISQVIQRSGVLLEANKKQSFKKENNERGKKLSAIHKLRVRKNIAYKKKMGISLKK